MASVAAVGSARIPTSPPRASTSHSQHIKISTIPSIPRRNAIAFLVSSFIFSQVGSWEVTFAAPTVGFREHIDLFDGYSFLYPENWIQVKGASADIFFKDSYVLDENISMELSSPSSSRYENVQDLGPLQAAAEKCRLYVVLSICTKNKLNITHLLLIYH